MIMMMEVDSAILAIIVCRYHYGFGTLMRHHNNIEITYPNRTTVATSNLHEFENRNIHRNHYSRHDAYHPWSQGLCEEKETSIGSRKKETQVTSMVQQLQRHRNFMDYRLLHSMEFRCNRNPHRRWSTFPFDSGLRKLPWNITSRCLWGGKQTSNNRLARDASQVHQVHRNQYHHTSGHLLLTQERHLLLTAMNNLNLNRSR